MTHHPIPVRRRSKGPACVHIIDRSGSMDGRMKLVWRAVAAQLAVRRSRFPWQWAGVLAFDDSVEEPVRLRPVRKIPTAVLVKLQDIPARGRTVLAPALALALLRLKALDDFGREVTVFSDGEIHDAADVLAMFPAIKAAGIRVDVVTYGQHSSLLQFMARETGGTAYQARTLNRLAETLSAVH